MPEEAKKNQLFPKGLSIPELEEKVAEYWEAEKTFEQSLLKTKDGEPFTFYDGPPFATGLPHYGHILASTIKDVIPRYQTMKGRYVRRRWGWDCHGLPIEEIVERELKISGKKQIEEIGIAKFNETCRTMVLQFVDEWRKMIRRMGRWVEFDNSYKTMDRPFMESVWWAFKQLWDKGLVYEGRKVLLYCPRCETPVSNFEVAMDNSYKDVTEESVFVKFQVVPSVIPSPTRNLEILRSAQDDRGVRTYFLAWTTTPWTLPGNVALAVGSDIVYVAARVNDEIFILAKELAEKVLGAGYELVAEMKGSDLVGLAYEPLFDVPSIASERSYKVYAADFVTITEGTGIVHTAVVYGEDDYQLGLREDLPAVPLLDEKGHFNEKAPGSIRGQYFKKAEKEIKDSLEQRGLLFARAAHTHSYPHCWRCSTALYYNAIPAWFVNVQKIKSGILDSNEREVNWYPDHLKHGRYQKSVEAAPDWNISRNRYWGNPIPAWKCTKCEAVKVIGSIAELGTDLPDLHRPAIDEIVLKCDKCGGEARRVPEIFDSWVEAGSMPFAEYHYPFENKEEFEKRYPAQFVAEYIAQTRAWFYVMHVVGFSLLGKAPFENVVTTGTILAEDGSKMSKSKKNYPDPWAVIEKYGVDSLRFYLMNSVVMQADNLNFSEKDLGTVHRKVTMLLWNVFHYYTTYAPVPRHSEPDEKSRGATGSFGVPQDDSHVLDRWINARTKELVRDATLYLDGYDTVRATRAIENYIDDLSTWYLRRSRGRTDGGFFATFRDTLIVVSQIIAPFMPHIAEAVYMGVAAGPSVHLTDWPIVEELTEDEKKLLAEMAIVREAASIGLAIRKQHNIPVKQPLARVSITTKGPSATLSSELLDILKDELNVKEVLPEELAMLNTQGGSIDIVSSPSEHEGVVLWFDIRLTPELKLEYLTRSLERFVQEMRKTEGFKVGETAELVYATTDPDIEKALATFNKEKTYVSAIVPGTPEHSSIFESDGRSAAFSLSRA